MRTTKHGGGIAEERGWAVGLPVALLAVGVVVCLVAAFLTGAARPPVPRSSATAPSRASRLIPALRT